MNSHEQIELARSLWELWNRGEFSPSAMIKQLQGGWPEFSGVGKARIERFRLHLWQRKGKKFSSANHLLGTARFILLQNEETEADDESVEANHKPENWVPWSQKLIEAVEKEDLAFKKGVYIPFSHGAFNPSPSGEMLQRAEGDVAQNLSRPQVNVALLADEIQSAEADLARILSLRLFGGLTVEETAGKLKRPVDSVRHDWLRAAEWLSSRSPQAKAGEGGSGQIVTFRFIDEEALRCLCHAPELMKTLNWRTFERVIARTLENLGFEIELQQGTKDGGIDVLALKRDSIFGAHRYLVQVKRWQNKVGVDPVRQLLFLHQHHKASKSCLATTSTFTSGALALAAEYRWQLDLRDHKSLREWIQRAAEESVLGS